MEQRMVLRAKLILVAAAGPSTAAIVQQLDVRAAMMSQWRGLFAPVPNSDRSLACCSC
jgi:hypothetical protein